MYARTARGMIRSMNSNEHRNAIDRVCRLIDSSDAAPDLTALAREAGLSPWHFQRVFKAALGISPKRYAMARRQQRLSQQLRAASSVTDAIFDAGYATSSAAYRDSKLLGMAPARLRTGGVNERIRYTTADTSLGPILVAATERGICMVEFGGQRTLLAELHRRFAKADIERADDELAEWVRQVVAHIDDPAGTDAGLPLDIRGTAFQVRVWNALTRLLPGETVSYSELARRIKSPDSTRAVARACATNQIAVLVPCHRVIGSDGNLRGYKWGLARKRKLLTRESSISDKD